MSNVYLNEFDRFVKHDLKPLAYLRYGDDWLCFTPTKAQADKMQERATLFLEQTLKLTVNPKINFTKPVWKGVNYLGVSIWPDGYYLQKSVRDRIMKRVNQTNVSSYRSLLVASDKPKRLKELDWKLLD